MLTDTNEITDQFITTLDYLLREWMADDPIDTAEKLTALIYSNIQGISYPEALCEMIAFSNTLVGRHKTPKAKAVLGTLIPVLSNKPPVKSIEDLVDIILTKKYIHLNVVEFLDEFNRANCVEKSDHN